MSSAVESNLRQQERLSSLCAPFEVLREDVPHPLVQVQLNRTARGCQASGEYGRLGGEHLRQSRVDLKGGQPVKRAEGGEERVGKRIIHRAVACVGLSVGKEDGGVDGGGEGEGDVSK